MFVPLPRVAKKAPFPDYPLNLPLLRGRPQQPVFRGFARCAAYIRQLENPLAKSILEGRFGPKDTIRVVCENGIMRFAKA